MESVSSFIGDLKVYFERRVLVIFLLGVTSGFPWVMIGSALSAWLQESGVSRTEIGLLSGISVVFAINFLWSPLIDAMKVPIFSRYLGQRKGWIIACQLLISTTCYIIATANVIDNLPLLGVLLFLIAIASATQDIAIDAFRIESFSLTESRLQSAGAAMTTAGWWTGYAGLGAVPFFLVGLDNISWQKSYLALCYIMLALSVLAALFKTERYIKVNKTRLVASRSILRRLEEIAFSPLREFFTRNGTKFALSVLMFIFLFKIGEAFLGKMAIVFYKEVGFSNSQIGTYSKLTTWWVTITFSLVGSIVNLRFGIVKGLFLGGLAMAASNLMFSLIALIGPSNELFLSAVIIDGFTGAWGTVAFVAFISLLCNRKFTASQYALFASLGTLGRTLLSSSSGFIVDVLNGNWALFFFLTALMVLPSLFFLWHIRHKLTAIEHSQNEQ